jgi:hypothetical protein
LGRAKSSVPVGVGVGVGASGVENLGQSAMHGGHGHGRRLRSSHVIRSEQ